MRVLVGVFVAVFVFTVFLLMWSAALHKDLNHDENMYIASGALLLRDGLLPYRDYPYFQMPLLTLVYAGLFSLGDHLLLLARTFSVLCATGTAVLLFAMGCSAFRGRVLGARVAAGVAASALFVLSPVTEYASGIAWNHDLPILLAVGAFAALRRGSEKDSGLGWVVLSGLLVALAAEARLTFALLAIPLGLGLLMGDRTGSRKGRALAAFAAGGLLGALPAIVLFALAPEQFVFGNLGYHGFNATYWQQLGYTRAMTLDSKLSYLWEIAREPGTLALLVGAGIALILALVTRREDSGNNRWGGLALGCAVALLVGALGPSPTWYQYFYAVVPFVVLALVFFAAGTGMRRVAGWTVLVPVAAAILCASYTASAYRDGSILLKPGSWVPEKVHQTGVDVVNSAGNSRMLTLSPLYPLEGGAAIYPTLATGPFGWRVAPLLSPEERAAQGLPDPSRIDSVTGQGQPSAILTGSEPGLESPFIDYAKKAGFKGQTLPGGQTLWMPKR